MMPETANSQSSGKAAAKRLTPKKGSAKLFRTVDIPKGTKRLFVLDTNVLMHDPTSLFSFEEHDVFLPMMTLEELDNHKKGTTEVARNARQVSRSLDKLIAEHNGHIEEGIPLSLLGNKDSTGRLFFQTEEADMSTSKLKLPLGKADNQIITVVWGLKEQNGEERAVILVSKDINMRVKARTLGLYTEDYTSDKTLSDTDLLYSGYMLLPHSFWDEQSGKLESWKKSGHTFYRITNPLVRNLFVGQFVYLDGNNAFNAQVRQKEGDTAVFRILADHTHEKNEVWGIMARNREQNFALNALMDPECDFVTLVGQAGSGKTLLALAAGLEQTLEKKRYQEIIVTRATVPVGEDIGFLPGTEEEKMAPWMGALSDNLEVLCSGKATKYDGVDADDFHQKARDQLLRGRVHIKSMNFMRGRTFLSKYVIIDECQNLTPKQMKTLVTRAGPGTKIVCLGNLAQIDTPYLTEGSSGLTFVVDRFKDWEFSSHITLQRGERSRLAGHAEDVL